MLYKPIINYHRKRHAAFIYAVVFSSRFSVWLIFVLFTSFIIQPIHQAYANEAAADVMAEEVVSPTEEVRPQEETVPTETIEDVEEQPETDTDTTIIEEDKIVDETIAPTEELVEIESENLVSNEEQSAEISNNDIDPEVSIDPIFVEDPAPDNADETASSSEETAVDSEQASSSSESNIDIDDSIASTSDTGSNSPIDDAEVDSSGSTIDDSDVVADPDTEIGVQDEVIQEEETSNDNSSSSGDSSSSSSDDQSSDSSSADVTSQVIEIEPAQEAVSKIESFVNDDNFYQFSKDSCVAVGEGAYHCSANDGTVIDSQSVVYSDIGESGYSEIFIRTANGDIQQLTDNKFDDTSPHYDPESKRVTWQRMIDGRYQIILYDIEEAEETQLTYSRTNSMEPSVSNAGVVWQAWDNNDWEIMFYDGTYTDQLTDNDTQDVAPVLEDEYIIWTIIGPDSQLAQVYSLKTKEIVTISNYEGGSIINPRFVLVYDTQFDNGDVVTQGFDPETGFSAPIAAKPAEAPLEIPETDSTGETRALIQNKSSSKQTVVVQLGDAGDGTGSSSPDVNSEGEIILDLNKVSTTSDQIISSNELEVDLESLETITPTTTEDFIELTEYDLILPPTSIPSTTDVLPSENASSTQE